MVSGNEPGALVLALHRATHATLAALQARLADLDLTASEINALANLADGRPRSIGELAADTATKPTTLTSVLDRLVRRRYVVRQLDPADRRSFLVSLTSDGRPVADTARAAMRDIERAALAMVTGTDLAGFHSITRALTEASR
ncbi:MAG TPA: MarR family transcriptional regulator [Streptosporangiaceae bacterium]|nr:MarR family transcriptional regulator [Streptosporangiaceae bacterium]